MEGFPLFYHSVAEDSSPMAVKEPRPWCLHLHSPPSSQSILGHCPVRTATEVSRFPRQRATSVWKGASPCHVATNQHHLLLGQVE